MDKIRVLIIDDSALIRGLLREIIHSQPDMEVVGSAQDPIVARDLIKELNPDVLTLDVEMPRMNGLEFLEKLMRLRPMPVVMVSTLTAQGSEAALQALELGAVDYITKPKVGVATEMAALAEEIGDKIRAAARARLTRRGEAAPVIRQANPITTPHATASGKIICVGASTGGTEAIKAFLSRMPADSPPILMTQHMPEAFTASFAQRLDGLSAMKVKEAQDNERILPGHAYLAPGHSHLLLKKSGGTYYTVLSSAPPVNRHRPSVDVLFESAAEVLGKQAIGVIMTGMGKDGAAGLLAMRHTGAYTIAQDEHSCVVYGMPRAAVELGAADEVITLNSIAGRVLELLAGKK